MAQLFAFLFGTNLRAIVFRVLALLGIGLITFTGGDLLIEQLFSVVESQFDALPPQIEQVIGLMQLDRFVTIVLSAYGVRFALTSVGGVRRRLGVR